MSLATHTKKEGLNTLEMRGIQTKLERAHESLEGLSSRIAFHCANEKVRLETATRQATDLNAGYQEPETVYEYSIAVGEIAYNLRSALDHLIWQLVSANGESPNHRNEFPIFNDASDYHKSVGNRLRGLDDRQRGMIESFQPFQDNQSAGRTCGCSTGSAISTSTATSTWSTPTQSPALT